MREFATIYFISEFTLPKTVTGQVTFVAQTAHHTPNISLCIATRVLVWNFLPKIIGYFECLLGRFRKSCLLKIKLLKN
jgi:hypothetical protein